MARGDSRSDRQVLRDNWSRWTGIVALYARRSTARHWVRHDAYMALRRELIAACRSLADAEGERRAYYMALEEMIRPWLSPRALERSDREILISLLHRCREVDRELSGRRRRRDMRLDLGRAPLIATAALLVGLGWASLDIILPVLNAVGRASMDAVDIAWLTIKHSDDLWKWSVLAVLVIAAAILIVPRKVGT